MIAAFFVLFRRNFLDIDLKNMYNIYINRQFGHKHNSIKIFGRRLL